MPDTKLMLLGFSDSGGTYAQNQALSHDRAKQVEDELSARGVHTSLVDALGQKCPLARMSAIPAASETVSRGMVTLKRASSSARVIGADP